MIWFSLNLFEEGFTAFVLLISKAWAEFCERQHGQLLCYCKIEIIENRSFGGGAMSQAVRSFEEQLVHYFLRPHDHVPTGPVRAAAAWDGETLAARPGEWTVVLTPDDLWELETAGRAALSRGLELDQVDRTKFLLPNLADKVAAWRRELMHGRGFLLVRGLPIEDWGPQLATYAYWGLGHHLGAPGAQNPQGELLGHVKDYAEAGPSETRRAYRGRDDIRYHCDGADVVGLLCLQPALSGGRSRIISSVTVFNEIWKRAPELVPHLFEPFAIDRRGEERPGEKAYGMIPPCAFDGTTLRTFYHGDYFRSVARHGGEAVPSSEQATLLDLYEEFGAQDGLYLDMEFRQGDIQVLSNHVTLHARTAYEDHPDPARKRHLLRLWLSLNAN